jgi:hypothetical protein
VENPINASSETDSHTADQTRAFNAKFEAYRATLGSPPGPEPLPQVGARDAAYKDSTPALHVGNSAFEDWFQAHPRACEGNDIKQMARDAYAAGMGDPLVTYANPHPKTAAEPNAVQWRVALVISSANPGKLVPWLATSTEDQRHVETHRDFVRWLSPPQAT